MKPLSHRSTKISIAKNKRNVKNNAALSRYPEHTEIGIVRQVCYYRFFSFVLMELACFPEAGGLDNNLLRFLGVGGGK
jgi:hypothetical protein